MFHINSPYRLEKSKYGDTDIISQSDISKNRINSRLEIN